MTEWGSELKTLKEIEESTGITPPALLRKPKLRDDCQGYYSTFQVLSDQRSYNQAGAQPLRITEIASYLTFLGISGVDRKQKFMCFLLEMDKAFMALYFKKQEAKHGKG